MNTQKSHKIVPFIKKNRYYNHAHDTVESLFFATIPAFLKSIPNRKKRRQAATSEWVVTHQREESSVAPRITWIGHSTFLIQMGGINIITDPIFGNASFFFPRILAPGITPDALPKIDVVILSHNHLDHTDLASLKALKHYNPGITILSPVGDKKFLNKHGFASVIEHEWWQTHSICNEQGTIEFAFVPAHHWSARGIFDRNKSLWGSWMITHKTSEILMSAHGEEGSKSLSRTIYFGGDSAYAHHYHHIATEFPRIHAALMPIAPCEPDPSMRKSHMDAKEAVQAFIDLKADHFIPMHWGTFPFGVDTFEGPLHRLHAAWKHHKLDEKEKVLTVLKVGQSFTI